MSIEDHIYTMETDRKEFIKGLLQQGKSREETKVQLVSNGYSSLGFETEYTQLLAELNLKEPSAPSAFFYDKKVVEVFKHSKAESKGIGRKLVSLIIFLCIVGIVVAGVIVVFPFVQDQFSPDVEEAIKWGKDAQEDIKTESDTLFHFTDTLIESKVESINLSANLYVKRVGTYDGLCKDISVVEPVVCLQTTTTYVLFAPLDAGYYCIDSKGFKGGVTQRPNSGNSCGG